MMMNEDICGIYLITNKNIGQMYVGQSIHIRRRFNEHRATSSLGHSRIDNAINKYGAENFSFEIIMTVENDTEKLNNAEREWISILNTYEDDFHYNLTPGGDFNPMKVPEIAEKFSGENHPMYNKKHSEKTRKKISATLKGKKLSEEHKKKISEGLKGREISEDTRQKISEAMSGENNPNYGKKHSEKTRKKMSEARNTTGYYRVDKHKSPRYRQGFRYRYSYYNDGKHHAISSVDIKKLEKKVKQKGLPWFKLEE